nr:uncharacterized protein LOC109185045 [Ipomoea trifida]
MREENKMFREENKMFREEVVKMGAILTQLSPNSECWFVAYFLYLDEFEVRRQTEKAPHGRPRDREAARETKLCRERTGFRRLRAWIHSLGHGRVPGHEALLDFPYVQRYRGLRVPATILAVTLAVMILRNFQCVERDPGL